MFWLWLLLAWAGPPQGNPAVLDSAYAPDGVAFTADPAAAGWADAPRVEAAVDYFGKPVAGPPTEIRSRWTKDELYLLYICPYDELNLKPDPNPAMETSGLWNWDVAEAFIGSDFEHIGKYKEFEVSPHSEWVDLDIDRDSPRTQQGMAWNSGYAVKARVDAGRKIWYGEMRIPFRAIDSRLPEPGRELRLGLFRISGPNKVRYLWRPSGRTTFHVPQAFGTLRLR